MEEVGARRGDEAGFNPEVEGAGAGETERVLNPFVGDATGVDNDGAMRYELLVTESERNEDGGGGARAEEECEYACCAYACRCECAEDEGGGGGEAGVLGFE